MNRNGIGVGVEVKLIYYGVGCTNVLRKSRGTYGTIKKNLDRDRVLDRKEDLWGVAGLCWFGVVV